jgi:hypothetical protein
LFRLSKTLPARVTSSPPSEARKTVGVNISDVKRTMKKASTHLLAG